MEPTRFSLQQSSGSTTTMLTRRKTAARSGDRLLVGVISESVEHSAAECSGKAAFMGKGDLGTGATYDTV